MLPDTQFPIAANRHEAGLPERLSEEDYLAVEHLAYEAAVIPELWPVALTKLNAVTGTGGVAMVCLNERGTHMMTTPNMEEIGRRFVEENWMERNSRGRLAFEKGYVGVSRFATGEELFGPGEQEHDQMTNELFKPYGFGYVAGFITQLPHGDTIIMNVEQYSARGPVDEVSLAKLNRLYPHLARALLVAGRADFERSRTAVETLTALGIPAAVVSGQGRILLTNDAFVTSNHVWTTGARDRLVLHDRIADRMLGEALGSLALARSPRSIPVRALPGSPITTVIQVVPIRRAAHDVFGSAEAIVVLSQARDRAHDAALIQSLFDLTPAEIAVAQSIARGQTVADIARANGRSVTTVRNQLKSAMAKTGSSRQVELVLLMQQLRGPAN